MTTHRGEGGGGNLLGEKRNDLESICFSDNLFQLLKIFKEAECKVCTCVSGSARQTQNRAL